MNATTALARGAMRHLRRLRAGLAVALAAAELAARPELWRLLTLRQDYEGSAHGDTESIILRGPRTVEGLWDNLDCVDFPTLGQLQATLTLLREVAAFLKVREIGRVMLVRLKANGRITPHVDEGGYARYFARFHVALDTHPACRFHVGEESAHMAAGELWWFNHQVRHWVDNKGPARIHLIADFAAPGFTGALTGVL
jgi:hypothetical protein